MTEVAALTLGNPIEKVHETRREEGRPGIGCHRDRGVQGVTHDHSAVSTFARL